MEHKIKGLTDSQVEQSRAQHGENTITPPKRDPLWKLFLQKFNDPIIKVLLVAAVLSLVISIIEGEYAETIGIFFAIFLATGISFWFEYDAGRKFELLNQTGDELYFKVIRNGNITEISRRDIVVGDVVVLDSGEEIPADGVLLEAISLSVNESSLTGEPITRKTTNPKDFNPNATYPSNQLMRGTTVVEGGATIEITAVGDNTEYGHVAMGATMESGEKTPLNIQLEKLAGIIGKVGFSIAILTFLALSIKDLAAVGFSFEGDTMGLVAQLLQNFMVAVTLIVVSVPEGLPMSVTLSLALSMRRMLKSNNLVRKIHACETMGAATVICTDKTGTLTRNQMSVAATDFFSLKDQKLGNDHLSNIIEEGIALNTSAHLDITNPEKIKAIGNPTEGALLLWLRGQGKDYMELRSNAEVIDVLTFSTERKFMATLAGSRLLGRRVLYVKGAPEIVLGKAPKVLVNGEELPSADYKAKIDAELLGYQNQAMRTLGFAYAFVDDSIETIDAALLAAANELIFIGVTAIMDPVRDDVPDAVRCCLNSGIKVKIVTGDTPGTAKEIGRQVGIWTAEDTDINHITGIEFAAKTDDELLELVDNLKIMSRARPMDKQRLVQLLQRRGHVVAVTGDGTNDAPALNFAQVGLSMGSGTSVAKEASDITLLDDSFTSIVTAVMWGRSLYRNIQRFVVFQLTINLVALVVVLLGTLFGTTIPLTVTQMLWVNLIMDTFAAAALASLPPDPKVMKNKPRKTTDFIITRSMIKNIIFVGVLFIAVLLSMLWALGDENGNLSVYNLSIFFTTFVMLQFWNMFNAKALGSNDSIFHKWRESKAFLGVIMLILVGQIIIVNFGGEVFRTEAISLKDWAIVIAATSLVMWAGEIIRAIKRYRIKE